MSATASPAVLTVYSTVWCGYCHRLTSALDRAGVDYDVVDIERDPAAASFVSSVNGGDYTVPTVKFADGSTQTNPTLAAVLARLLHKTRC